MVDDILVRDCVRDENGRVLVELVEDNEGDVVDCWVRLYVYSDGRVDVRVLECQDEAHAVELFDALARCDL